jgi:hypothetical protein
MQHGIRAAAREVQVHYSMATWCCAAQRDVLARHVHRVLQVVLQAPASAVLHIAVCLRVMCSKSCKSCCRLLQVLCCAAQCGVLTRHVQQILHFVLQAPARALHLCMCILRVLSRCT